MQTNSFTGHFGLQWIEWPTIKLSLVEKEPFSSEDSRNSHILIIVYNFIVSLTLKIATQYIYIYYFFLLLLNSQLMLLLHNHIMFGYKSLSSSEQVFQTKPGHMDRQSQQFQYNPTPTPNFVNMQGIKNKNSLVRL